MAIEHPAQLAQLLGRIAALYPHGIPTTSIVAPAEQPVTTEAVKRVRARLVVIGEKSNTSDEEIALLDAIATKGLMIAAEDYTKEFVDTGSSAFAPGSPEGAITILFGSASVPEGAVGHVVATNSLTELAGDPALKKRLWRELQGVGK